MVTKKQRVRYPTASDGIQVNHCKNPLCLNYGVLPSETRAGEKYRTGLGGYVISGGSYQARSLHCKLCLKNSSIRSNLAITQELTRFRPSFLRLTTAACINDQCTSYGKACFTHQDHYYHHGKTASGEPRYRCKRCGSTFSVGLPIRRQRRPELNVEVYKLLVNKVPMRRICEILDINPATLYNKLGYLDHISTDFVERQELRLINSESFAERAYVSVDRQDHTLNWGTQLDRRNIILGVVGAVENSSGYALALQLNFDSSLDARDVEADALQRDDYGVPPVFRHYARVWLERDYLNYTVGQARPNEEEGLDTEFKLPHSGVQVHIQYTQAALFFHLRSLLGGFEKIRFFLDRDQGMDAACLSAFVDEIKARRVDVFVIHGPKELTMAQKKTMISRTNKELERYVASMGLSTDSDTRQHYLISKLKKHKSVAGNKDWFQYPFADMAEPEKSILYMTDFNDYDIDHLARLYRKASLRGIDRFFMQIRRRVSILERPIASASRGGRTWHGYSAYSPLVVERLLRIFRVYYNFCHVGEDGKTPAMRLGLVGAPVSLLDLANGPKV